MDKKEKKRLKRYMQIHEILGAGIFKKFVLFLEKVKFKYGKKFFPNFQKNYEKYVDLRTKRALAKAKTAEERKHIKEQALFSKLDMRKEINQEKNRNYHLDENRPKETLSYLEWNKGVHKRGLIKNFAVIGALSAATVLGYNFIMPLIVFESICALINFQCVNLQDYNICRYKIAEKSLVKYAERTKKKKIEQYSDAAELIYDSITKADDKIPTTDEIVANSKNKEQLYQLKAYLEANEKRRKLQNSENKGVIK